MTFIREFGRNKCRLLTSGRLFLNGAQKCRQSKLAAVVGSSTSPAERKWRIAAAVCLERFPVIAPPLNDVQQRFSDLLMQLEHENSLLSEHELRDIADKKRTARSSKKKEAKETSDESKSENVGTITAKDFEQLALSELQAFKLAPSKTSADTSNDLKSLNRCLDRKLTLVVKQKMGENAIWGFPFALWNDGETLRQTAERILSEMVNKDEKFNFYGNAPDGVLKCNLPKPVQHKLCAHGLKIFYYKVQLKSKTLEIAKNETIEDFQWVTHDALSSLLTKKEQKSVYKFLFE